MGTQHSDIDQIDFKTGYGIHSCEYSTQTQNIDIHDTIENKHYIK